MLGIFNFITGGSRVGDEQKPVEFLLFPELPTELRLKIWRCALPERVIGASLHFESESPRYLSYVLLLTLAQMTNGLVLILQQQFIPRTAALILDVYRFSFKSTMRHEKSVSEITSSLHRLISIQSLIYSASPGIGNRNSKPNFISLLVILLSALSKSQYRLLTMSLLIQDLVLWSIVCKSWDLRKNCCFHSPGQICLQCNPYLQGSLYPRGTLSQSLTGLGILIGTVNIWTRQKSFAHQSFRRLRMRSNIRCPRFPSWISSCVISLTSIFHKSQCGCRLNEYIWFKTNGQLNTETLGAQPFGLLSLLFTILFAGFFHSCLANIRGLIDSTPQTLWPLSFLSLVDRFNL